MTKLEKQLQKAKLVLLAKSRLKGADFYIHVVPNREMETLRKIILSRPDWRGREADKIRKEDKVNVLAFPEVADFPHPETGQNLLGEVYLNSDFGKGDYATLGPLLVHGFLHLLGYRHYFERDRIKMQKLEKRLWDLTSSSDSILAQPR
jgi:ssRNA-specific RNase YbeY (16S rRNA maturation enzyme)